MLKIIKLMIILGQVRLALPHRVRKGIRIVPAGLELPAGARNRKKTFPQIICNNPRSSNKPGRATEPKSL